MELWDRWCIEDIENEIIGYLDDGKQVYIENGCLNDSIISYSVNGQFHEREVIFETSACVFPLHINLMESYSNIDTEDYKGSLFVKVS